VKSIAIFFGFVYNTALWAVRFTDRPLNLHSQPLDAVCAVFFPPELRRFPLQSAGIAASSLPGEKSLRVRLPQLWKQVLILSGRNIIRSTLTRDYGQ
jgi:hypothetical protein